jgi:hypothetical protein
MALKANEADFLANEHARVRRAVRFMARTTGLKAHGSVFEREGAAFVAMAAEASRFIRREGPHHSRAEASMRIVAIDARHRALWKAMLERFAELARLSEMTTRALTVDRGGFTCDERRSPVFVDEMTGYTTNLAIRVTALDAACMRRLT